MTKQLVASTTVADILESSTACKDIMKCFHNMTQERKVGRPPSMVRILLLVFLKNSKGLPFLKADLTKYLHIEMQTTAKAFMQLRKEGLIYHHRYEDDGRFFVGGLTEKGHALFKE